MTASTEAASATSAAAPAAPVAAKAVNPMRFTLLCGLTHEDAQTNTNGELARLLKDLAEQITQRPAMKVGDSIVLRDRNGNRVGVADIFRN